MLRYVTGYTTTRPQVYILKARPVITRCLASGRHGDADEAEIDAARKWLAKLDADTIRRHAVCDMSYSRSSGPGGQNVNK